MVIKADGQDHDYLQKAEEAMASGKMEEAIDLFQKAYTSFESEANYEGMVKSSLKLGYLYIGQRNMKESNMQYQSAAKIAKTNDMDSYYLEAIDAISTSYFLLGQPEKSIPFTRESIRLGRKLRDTSFYSGKLIGLGYSFFQTGVLDSAVIVLQDALQIKRNIGDLAGEHLALNYLGMLHYSIGDYEKAQFYHLQCLNEWTEKRDSTKMIGALKHLSNIYIALNDWDLAEEYALQANQIANELGHHIQEAYTKSNLARINVERKNYTKAIDQYLQIISLYRNSGNTAMLIDNLIKTGSVYQHLNQFERAESLINEAVINAEETEDHISKLTAYLAYGELLLNRSRFDDALDILHRAENLSVRVGMKPKQLKASQLLSATYAQKKQFEQSLFWSNKYIRLRDTLYQQQQQKSIYEMDTRFQVNKIERENELLQTKDQMNQLQIAMAKRRQLYLILGIIGLGVLALIAYSYYRSRQRDNRKLKEQARLIKKALTEKETLLREIHHRVKNNLQVVSSLLSIQSYQIKDSKAQEAVREGRNRVKSMSILHQNLYQTDFTSVNSKTYIRKLSESLFLSYNIALERISLKTDIESIDLDIDLMIPIGLILNELISNALKHAFAGQNKGLIEVLFALKEDHYLLEVLDNGVGLNEQFELENSKSMGLQLVHDFCKKLNATIKIEKGIGTHILLKIPVTDHHG